MLLPLGSHTCTPRITVCAVVNSSMYTKNHCLCCCKFAHAPLPHQPKASAIRGVAAAAAGTGSGAAISFGVPGSTQYCLPADCCIDCIRLLALAAAWHGMRMGSERAPKSWGAASTCWATCMRGEPSVAPCPRVHPPWHAAPARQSSSFRAHRSSFKSWQEDNPAAALAMSTRPMHRHATASLG